MCRKYVLFWLLCFILMKGECTEMDTKPKERIPANITIIVDHNANPSNASEVVFNLRSNHTLLCTANEPVRWLLRSSTENVEESNVTIAESPYAISLQLNGTMHDNAGYYHCVRAIKLEDIADPSVLNLATLTEMVKRRDTARLYIHVNEMDNVLVPLDVHEVHVFQYADVVIPCRRTIPTAQVQLKARRVADNKNNRNNNNDNRTNISINMGNNTAEEMVAAVAVNASAVGEEADVDVDAHYIVIATSEERWQRQSFPPDNIYTSIEYDRELGFIIRRVVRLSEEFLCVAQNSSDVESSASFRVHLLGFIHDNESAVTENFNVDDVAKKDIDIRVDYVGSLWPETNVSWTQQGKGIIESSKTRQVIRTDNFTMLTIRNAELEDTAEYSLTVRYQLQSKNLHFNVTISDMPVVNVSHEIVAVGSFAHLTCRTLAHPKASVTWLYRACLEPCDAEFERFDHHVTARPGRTRFEYLHDILFKPPATGVLRCEAINALGNRTGEGNVFISSEEEDFMVSLDSEDVVIGDEVRLTCAVRYYKYENDILWYKDDQLVEINSDIQLEDNSTEHTFRRVLIFQSIELSNGGRYTCHAQRKIDELDNSQKKQYDKKSIDVNVHALQPPHFNITNLHPDTPIEQKLGEMLELNCKPNSLSRANITWYKEDQVVNASEQIRLTDGDRKLVIDYLKPGDEGNYKCIATNALGSIESITDVIIKDLPAALKLGWIFGIVAFCIALVLLVIFLSISVYRERRLANELKAAGLALFEEGDIGNLNPMLSLGEQADLLPYDRRFEFPREKLKLGRQLGAGTFGVVYEAQAEGIQPGEVETCVAVKMVKRGADNETMRALVTELKILIHIGRHLNVVNLLGAVTQNIAKRELMVIVEHCRYGNLKDFLLKNREHFVDQIDQTTDCIDAKIMAIPQPQTNGNVNSGYQSWSSNELLQSTAAGTISTSLSGNYLDIPSVGSNKQNTASTTSLASSLNDNATITTSDLVSWAFQVGRGMHYLATMRVVHGDLAARNILLCSDNVVKICDFGLAHSLYKEEYYKKRGEGLLPIKWLSPESLSDNIFDVHTDVWAFGIMLWEFFSLARVPYPGLDPNIHFYEKLKSGYRMEKPVFANDEIYDIMLDCWNELPKERPLFDELEKRFARILGEEVTNHYITLNEDNYYTHSNSLYHAKGINTHTPTNVEYAILDDKQTIALQEFKNNNLQ